MPEPAAPSTTVQFNLAKAFDTLVESLADRECIVWRDRRLTYAQVAERSRRLASYLHGRRLTVRRERSELRGWESGQDHVALALYNGNEYLEGMLGAYGARVAPFNVNYRYVGGNSATSSTTPVRGRWCCIRRSRRPSQKCFRR